MGDHKIGQAVAGTNQLSRRARRNKQRALHEALAKCERLNGQLQNAQQANAMIALVDNRLALLVRTLAAESESGGDAAILAEAKFRASMATLDSELRPALAKIGIAWPVHFQTETPPQAKEKNG